MNDSVMVSQIENSSIFELDINVIEQITVRKKKVLSILNEWHTIDEFFDSRIKAL